VKDDERSDLPVVPAPDPGDPVGEVDSELVDALLERAEHDGVDLLGPDGLLSSLTKTVLERALDAELTDHLGYERGDPTGRGSGNRQPVAVPPRGRGGVDRRAVRGRRIRAVVAALRTSARWACDRGWRAMTARPLSATSAEPQTSDG
jgi:hypothetical protein